MSTINAYGNVRFNGYYALKGKQTYCDKQIL